MSKYEVIKRIIETKKLSEDKKVDMIQTFLLGWLDENDLTWLWEE